MSLSDFDNMSVVTLRKFAKQFGVKQAGSKADLATRVYEASSTKVSFKEVPSKASFQEAPDMSKSDKQPEVVSTKRVLGPYLGVKTHRFATRKVRH